MFIIGSEAAKRNGFDLKRGEPKDIDVLGTLPVVEEYVYGFECFKPEEAFDPHSEWQEEEIECSYGKKVHYFRDLVSGEILHIEADIVESGTHNERVYNSMIKDSNNIHQGYGIRVASNEWLRFFKESHKYSKDSPHFWKTRRDIEFLRLAGVQYPEGSDTLFKEREQLTYTNKLPKLDVSKKEFFDGDDVPYRYDHDGIHEVVAVMGIPAYKSYMKDGSEVLTDKEKFISSPELIKLLGVLEESATLSYERSMIPFDFKPDRERAFRFALSKVCTSITGGYFREYAYNNCYKVLALYGKVGEDIHKRMFHAIEKNELKLFGE